MVLVAELALFAALALVLVAELALFAALALVLVAELALFAALAKVFFFKCFDLGIFFFDLFLAKRFLNSNICNTENSGFKGFKKLELIVEILLFSIPGIFLFFIPGILLFSIPNGA